MKHELFTMESTIDEIQLKNTEIDSVLSSSDKGWGLRVFSKGVGFASGTGDVDFNKAEKLSKLNKRPSVTLPSSCKAKSVKVFDKKLDANYVRDFAERFISLSKDSIALPTFSKVRLYTMKTNIQNSQGLDTEKIEKLFRFETSLKVKKGRKVSEVFAVKWAREKGGISDKDIKALLKGAESAIDARPPESFTGAVIFSPELVCDTLYPVIGQHASGASLYTKKSAFKTGDAVASKKLSIADDATYPYGILSSPFDGEGVACQKTDMIKSGKFKDRINDLLYGELTKLKSTGNASRMPYLGGVDNAYSVAPSLTASNMVVKAGRKTKAEIIRGITKGILIEECSWMNPDSLTGAFGSEIRRGFLIENGRITRAIKGGNVSGNVLEMIKSVREVGKHTKIASGHTLAAVAPYICFDNVKVSA